MRVYISVMFSGGIIMKRILIAVMALMMAFAVSAHADVATNLKAQMQKFMKDKKITNLSIDVKVLKQLNDPKGMYFVKMTLKEAKTGRTQDQFVFTDGKYIYPEVIKADTQMNIKDELLYSATPSVKLDMSKATFMEGNKKSKNIIVKVSDFQCPYCRRAYQAIHEIMKQSGKDAAVYMIQLPLAIHPKANVYARIFEAGLLVGKNFGADLYNTDQKTDALNDAKTINLFAAKTGNPTKFKQLVNSKAIKAKVAAQSAYASKTLGITGTPVIYFNGKPVSGFNVDMYLLAVKGLK